MRKIYHVVDKRLPINKKRAPKDPFLYWLRWAEAHLTGHTYLKNAMILLMTSLSVLLASSPASTI